MNCSAVSYAYAAHSRRKPGNESPYSASTYTCTCHCELKSHNALRKCLRRIEGLLLPGRRFRIMASSGTAALRLWCHDTAPSTGFAGQDSMRPPSSLRFLIANGAATGGFLPSDPQLQNSTTFRIPMSLKLTFPVHRAAPSLST